MSIVSDSNQLNQVKPLKTLKSLTLQIFNLIHREPNTRNQIYLINTFQNYLSNKEIQQPKTVKQDTVRVAINAPLGGPLAGPAAAAAAPPAVPLAPPRVVAPAARPRTAPVHLPVFDSSSSDEAIPNLFNENCSSDENLADLNLYAEQIARIPVDPLVADEVRQQEPEMRVPLVSSSSDDEIFSHLQQPRPALVPLNVESLPETHEEQFALTERKIRARPYNPKRKPDKSAFKLPENYQQRKNVRGFKIDRQVVLDRKMHALDWSKKKNVKQ